ncbi:MAG: hypothetical protein U0939_06275 [Pirellulales bacterium]
MSRLWGIVVGGLGLLWLAGCQPTVTSEAISATEEAGRATRPATAATAAPELPAPQTPPEQIVLAFLEASRDDRDQFASRLLSDKARDAAERAGLVLDPPGTPTMQFEIGEVEYPAEEPLAAYVTSRWREEAGPTVESFEVVWILRKQAGGWRIAGMASRDSADSTPSLVNFEDPQDLARVRHEVAGEPLAEGEADSASPHTSPDSQEAQAGETEAASPSGPAGVRERTARRPGGAPR